MLNAIGRTLVALPLAALILASGLVQAEEQSKPTAFEPTEEQAIREIVRQYLLDHPEVLIESLQAFQEREKLAAEARQREALKRQMTALTRDPDDPVLGNPNGDVTIVEFFDYRCPYCKRVAEGLRRTVEEDGNIRLVMKEYPILGPDSQLAARAALAAVEQGLYEEFHFALMTAAGKITRSGLMTVAEGVGLDADRLKRDMESEEVGAAIQKNIAMAQSLNITGTPAFVVGNQIVPGALDMRTLRTLIAEVRAGSS
jgi:protein-disulfide isomerase